METKTINLPNNSSRQAALIAGISILIMAIAAIFAFGHVYEGMVVPADASATAENILNSGSVFRLGIFTWLIILICDILAAWGLYVFFRAANENFSLLTAWFRVVYAAVLGIALYNFVMVLQLLEGDTMLSIFESEEVFAQALVYLQGFEGTWSMGLILFGIHLLLLGWLAFRSGFLPKWISVLLLLAGLGYVVVHTGKMLFPGGEEVISILNMVFMVPMIAGEVGMGIWLLVKGGRK